MLNYRRAFMPGGCWFLTVNLLDRRRRLLTDHIDALREATRLTQTRQPFSINAMVVLPDHIHAGTAQCASLVAPYSVQRYVM
jgi:putative transposase